MTRTCQSAVFLAIGLCTAGTVSAGTNPATPVQTSPATAVVAPQGQGAAGQALSVSVGQDGQLVFTLRGRE